MPDPTTTGATLAMTAGGLTVFGVVTGLHPALLVASLLGGWWALSYQPPMSPLRRFAAVSMSAVVGAWGAPPAVALLRSLEWMPQTATTELLQFPVALMVGFLSHTVIGPGLTAWARKRLEGAA